MFAGVSIVHSQVVDGNLSYFYDDKVIVQNNRKRFLQSHQHDLDHCVAARLTHSTDIATVTSADLGRGMYDYDSGVAGDAMVTTNPGVTLFLLTADCLPIVLCDPVRGVLSLAHVSKVNTAQHFVRKIIGMLSFHYHSDPHSLQVYIGPCIHKESYVVDLVELNRAEMITCGVDEKNIQVSPIDTYRSPDYYSHRRSLDRGESEGRFATIAKLQIS